MKGQVENSKCENVNEWMSEHASGLIIWGGNYEWTLKDGEISLMSSKVIFDQEESSEAE